LRKSAAVLCLGVSSVTAIPAQAEAELSANFGWVSDYIFRGIPQDDSSASAGIDYSNAGFYIGTWAADVGKGSEVDFYLGYEGSITDVVDYGIGATVYLYTDDFDDTYKEINLALGRGPISMEAAFGTYDNFDEEEEDYTFVSLSAEHNGFYVTAGTFAQDFDGEYVELGYGMTHSGLDFSISFVHSTKDLLGEDSDNSIVFGIGKTFDLKHLIARGSAGAQ
jgi:uncharacterized protein (TIGR02001 family)